MGKVNKTGIEMGDPVWYNVCKADIIPSRIWFSRLPRKSRRSILPEGYHVRRTWYNQDTDHIRESPAKKCQEVI